MKRIFALTLAVCMAVLPSVAQCDVVTFRADQWYPYTGDPASDEYPGYVVEIARMSLDGTSHKSDYDTMSWSRAITNVRLGLKDCVLAVSREEAPGFVRTENPIGAYRLAIWTMSDRNFRFARPKDLDDMSIAAQNGWMFSEEMESYLVNRRDVVGYDADKINDAIRRLQTREIDVMIESEAVVRALSHRNGIDSYFSISGYASERHDLYIACSSKHFDRSKEIVRLIDAKLLEMRASGALDTLLAKYGLADWGAK